MSPTEREIEDQIREARLYKLGQAAFLLVETIAAAVLTAIYFNAPRVLAVMIGVVIALLLGAAAAAMVTRWERHEAAVQPSKQLARITKALLVLGKLNVSALFKSRHRPQGSAPATEVLRKHQDGASHTELESSSCKYKKPLDR